MKFYIDNFRGIQEQFIDLQNVTFLVGENSSGKTSLMRAIDLLSDFNFLMNGEISSEDKDFYSFDDLISANRTSDSFSLGLAEEKDQMIEILSFNNEDGLPKCSRVVLFIKEHLIVLYFKKSYFEYGIKPNVAFNDVTQNLSKIDNLMTDVVFKKEEILSRVPFPIYLHFLAPKDRIVRGIYKDLEKIPFFSLMPCLFEAPIRAKPQNIYSGAKKSYTADGLHTPFVIKNALKEKNDKIKFLRKFGKESGLFDDIRTTIYGDNNSAPFELIVEKDGSEFSISSVGYGVSQILPIVVDMIFAGEPMILIQQPEVHLHPRAQAAFGEFVFNISQYDQNRKFVIETHSDYIIDRYRYCVKKSIDKRKNSGQIFFMQHQNGYNSIQVIPFNSEGGYECDDMVEYRKFFIDESLKIMEC